MAPKRQNRRARGTGTIQRQRDGSYIARTADKSRSGRFPAGQEGYRQAEEALERWNRAIGAGRNPNDSRQKVRDFARLWLADVVAPNCRPRTVEFYVRHIGYATAYIGDTPLEVVDEQAIERMLGKLAADGLSPRSVDHVRSVLHNMFGVAKRWKLRPDNPVSEVPRRNVEEEQGRILTTQEVSVLLAAVRSTRLECLYHIGLTLGLRRGELLGLRKTDVDLDTGLLTVAQQVTEDEHRRIVIAPYVKSDSGTRVLPLPPDLTSLIGRRLEEEREEERIFYQRAVEKAEKAGQPIPLVRWNTHGLLFPSEVGTIILPSNFNRRFAALMRKLGVAGATPHSLRRTALTDLAAHGEAKAVQSIAGHADIDTTMRIYAGRRMGAMRDAVEKMEKARKTG